MCSQFAMMHDYKARRANSQPVFARTLIRRARFFQLVCETWQSMYSYDVKQSIVRQQQTAQPNLLQALSRIRRQSTLKLESSLRPAVPLPNCWITLCSERRDLPLTHPSTTRESLGGWPSARSTRYSVTALFVAWTVSRSELGRPLASTRKTLSVTWNLDCASR